MCLYSMIHSHISRTFPPDHGYWTLETLDGYVDLIRKAKAFDKLMGMLDCQHTEDSKEAFIAEVLRKIEEK